MVTSKGLDNQVWIPNDKPLDSIPVLTPVWALSSLSLIGWEDQGTNPMYPHNYLCFKTPEALEILWVRGPALLATGKWECPATQNWMPGPYVPPQPSRCSSGLQTEATSLLQQPLLKAAVSHGPLPSAHTTLLPKGGLFHGQKQTSKASLADTYLFAMNGACNS